MKANYKTIIILLLILIMQVALRLPFIDVPLERDEGAYGYAAQRILSGGKIYKDAIDHKPPLIYFTYAVLVKFFGNTIQAIRVPTLFYSLITTAVIYFGWGGLAAFLFAIFSGGPLIQGATSNTETFMVLPLVLSLVFFLLYKKKENIWFIVLSGLFGGLAVFYKQVAIFNYCVIFGFLIYGAIKNKNLKSILYFITGSIIAPICLLAYFLWQGTLSEAIFCNLALNGEYVRANPGTFIGNIGFGLQVLWSQMVYENGLLYFFATIGILFAFIKDRSFENLLISAWLLIPFVGVFLSGRYFPHYFIQFIPGLCILSAYAIVSRSHPFRGGIMLEPQRLRASATRLGNLALVRSTIISLIIFVSALYAIPYQLPFYTTYSPDQISYNMYQSDEFIASYVVSNELKKSLKPNDSIVVWSANPEIYFYLNKKSPTPYFNYMKWMQNDARDKQIAKEIIARNPKYIIKARYYLRNANLEKYANKQFKYFMRAGEFIVFKRFK